MKAIGRILIVLLVIGLLILLGYVAYLYILPHWCALLFYSYCVVGLLIWTIGVVKNIAANRNSSWAEFLLKQIVKAHLPGDAASRMNRIRDTIAGLAFAVVNLILWPVDTAYGLILARKNKGKELTSQDFILLQGVGLPDTYKSLYALVVVLCMLGLISLGANLRIYGPITLALMIASASLRHMSYVVGTVSLPARLRRGPANPYALFLVVAALDFSTLILGLAALDLRAKSDSIRWPALVKTGRELLQGEGALWNILKGMRPTLHQLIVAIVGLLFSIALLKVVLEFREFKRKDEDYVWVARSSNVLGNFSAALRQLRNVKSWDADSRWAEIIALLGVNQIDNAAAKLKSMLEDQRKPVTEGTIFTNMIQAFLLPHMPQGVYLAVLKRGIDSNVPDAIMQDSLGLVVQYQLHEPALALFAGAKACFPLSVARLHLLSGDLPEALATLEAHPPSSDVEKLIGQVLAVTARLADDKTTREQDVETFSRFAEETIPLMRKLVNLSLELLQRVTVFLEIKRALAFAQEYGPERVEELRFLADSLAEQQKDDEFKRAISVIEAQFQ